MAPLPKSSVFRGGRLTRLAGMVVLAEAAALVALGAAGLWTSTRSGAPDPNVVLGFRLNVVHSAVLTGTGLLAAFATWQNRWLRRFLTLQALGYLVLYVVSVVASGPNMTDATVWGLNVADRVLHVALFVLGMTLAVVITVDGYQPSRRAERSTSGSHGT